MLSIQQQKPGAGPKEKESPDESLLIVIIANGSGSWRGSYHQSSNIVPIPALKGMTL